MTVRTDKSARTARSILDRSLPVFAAKGPHGASAKDIAKACRLSVGSIYVHFGSKDLLYVRLLEESLQRSTAHARERAQSESPLQRVWDTGEAYIQFAVDHPDACRLLARGFELETTDPLLGSAQRRFDAMVDAEIKRLQDDVELAMRSGEVAATDPRDLAIFLGSTWTGVVALMLRTDRFAITAEDARRMLASAQRVVTDGTAAPASAAGW